MCASVGTIKKCFDTKYCIYFNSDGFEHYVVVVYTAVRHVENLYLPLFFKPQALCYWKESSTSRHSRNEKI